MKGTLLKAYYGAALLDFSSAHFAASPVFEVDSARGALDYPQDRGREVTTLFADVRLPSPINGIQLAKAACTL
jgi:DNA-binding LytR/AlgR family response regulator